MARAHSLPRLYGGVLAGLTLVGVVLRTIAMLTVFDPAIGYFNEGILSFSGRALYVVVVVAALIGARFLPGDDLPAEWHLPLRRPLSLLLGLSLAGFTVGYLILHPAVLSSGTPLLLALAGFGVLGSIYFLLTAARQGRFPGGLCALMWPSVLWCLAAVAETYSDVYVTMNSPVKLSLQMGFVGFMLLLMTELRFRLGKPMPRTAAAFLGIGTFCTLNASIPLLFAASAWNHTLHTLYATVLLAAGLYGAYAFCYYFFVRPAVPAAVDLADIPAEDALAAEAPLEETPGDSAID